MNVLARTFCIVAFFSKSREVPALLSPALPHRVFVICDKEEDKLDRCTIWKPSSAQPFCSGNSMWLQDFRPLGEATAVDVAGCLAHSTAGELHPQSHLAEAQLCSIWLHPSPYTLSCHSRWIPERSEKDSGGDRMVLPLLLMSW